MKKYIFYINCDHVSGNEDAIDDILEGYASSFKEAFFPNVDVDNVLTVPVFGGQQTSVHVIDVDLRDLTFN